MYQNNTTDKTKCEVLKDVKRSKERPWQQKKLRTLELADSYKRLGLNKSYRIHNCGSFLEFKRYMKDGSLKLNQANFCKARLCPMCSWRRSLKIFGQVSKVMDQAIGNKNYRFVFLTLTCRNIKGEDLSSQIDNLFKSYLKLMRRKAVKTSVKGWFRALEVTHNLITDTYHPHFHVVIAVNKSYFNDKDYYLSQDQWTQLWKDCMQVDYTPVVDVRAFKVTNNKRTSKSIAEAAKYAVKDADFIIKDSDGKIDEKLTDLAVWTLDNALSYRRLIAFGGEFKKIHKQLNLDDAENGDLINTDNEELREDLDYIIERYHWNIGYKQYVKIED